MSISLCPALFFLHAHAQEEGGRERERTREDLAHLRPTRACPTYLSVFPTPFFDANTIIMEFVTPLLFLTRSSNLMCYSDAWLPLFFLVVYSVSRLLAFSVGRAFKRACAVSFLITFLRDFTSPAPLLDLSP